MIIKFKAIIFDLSEVYLKGIWMVEEKLEKVLKLPKSVIKNAIFKKPELNFDLLMKGKISEDEYLLRIIKENNFNTSIEAMKKTIRENFEEIEGTREIIEKLKKKGYKLGLLSNHSKEWIEHCESKFHYHKLFHSTLYSFEIEACKPNKKTYLHILKKLDANPEECLFIDDSSENVKAARELGLAAIEFKNPTQLISELKKIGVEL